MLYLKGLEPKKKKKKKEIKPQESDAQSSCSPPTDAQAAVCSPQPALPHFMMFCCMECLFS